MNCVSEKAYDKMIRDFDCPKDIMTLNTLTSKAPFIEQYPVTPEFYPITIDGTILKVFYLDRLLNFDSHLT